jgi:hypothetical protein
LAFRVSIFYCILLERKVFIIMLLIVSCTLTVSGRTCCISCLGYCLLIFKCHKLFMSDFRKFLEDPNTTFHTNLKRWHSGGQRSRCQRQVPQRKTTERDSECKLEKENTKLNCTHVNLTPTYIKNK